MDVIEKQIRVLGENKICTKYCVYVRGMLNTKETHTKELTLMRAEHQWEYLQLKKILQKANVQSWWQWIIRSPSSVSNQMDLLTQIFMSVDLILDFLISRTTHE
jgi:hypothetical protein